MGLATVTFLASDAVSSSRTTPCDREVTRGRISSQKYKSILSSIISEMSSDDFLVILPSLMSVDQLELLCTDDGEDFQQAYSGTDQNVFLGRFIFRRYESGYAFTSRFASSRIRD